MRMALVLGLTPGRAGVCPGSLSPGTLVQVWGSQGFSEGNENPGPWTQAYLLSSPRTFIHPASNLRARPCQSPFPQPHKRIGSFPTQRPHSGGPDPSVWRGSLGCLVGGKGREKMRLSGSGPTGPGHSQPPSGPVGQGILAQMEAPTNLYLPEPTAMLTKSEHRPSTLPYCLQSQPGAALAGDPHSCRGGHVQQQQPEKSCRPVQTLGDPRLPVHCQGY